MSNSRIQHIALPFSSFAEQASTPDDPPSGVVKMYRKTDDLWYVLDENGTESSFGNFTNPMTTKGDLIVGSNSGASYRLPVGGSNTMLLSDDTQTLGVKWGDVNPMTSAEDIIKGGTAGAWSRVAAGTEGQVLSVSNSVVQWADATGGGGGAALTVTDESGTVSDTAVTSITVPDGTLVDDGVGLVTLREVPSGVIGASVYKSSDQLNLTASTANKITFDSTSYDTDSIFDDGNDRLTVPAGMGGKWLIEWGVGWAAVAANTDGYILIYKNGSPVRYVTRHDYGTSTPQAESGAIFLDLAAGDYVELYVNPGSTQSNNDVRSGSEWTWLSIIKLGSGTVGETIGAKAYNSAVQSVPNVTFTALSLDSEEFDTDALHSTSSNTSRLTIPLGGKWLVQGRTQFAASATGERILKVRKNGTTDVSGRWGSSDPGAGSSEYVSGAEVIDLAAGDYIELMAYQGSGGNLNTGGTAAESWTHFSAILLATQGSGALKEGTAFPTGPATGDRYRRTDLDYMVFFYDGTRWLSETLYVAPMPPYNNGDEQPNTTAPVNLFRMGIPTFDDDFDLWIERFIVTARSSSTNDGSNYWTMDLQAFDGSSSDTLGTADTSAMTVGVAGRDAVVIDTLIDASVELLFQTNEAKVGAPGALDLYMASITYRLSPV